MGAAERHVEREKKEEREGTPMHWEDGTGSIILRSAYVCLFVTEHWSGSLVFCVCLDPCVCAGGREGGIRGEA